MNLSIKRRCLLSLIALCAAAPVVQAQGTKWPNKPLRIILTFPPGGSSDSAARIVAPVLSERLGQPVIIDNRPGAGGGIGLGIAAKSPPDGYTLVLASAGGLTANPSLYKHLAYQPARDFAPVTLFGTSPFVLLANAQLPVRNLAELIKLAQAKPGALSYASGGSGTAMHLSGELMKSMARIDLMHVPFRGSGPALMAMMGGDTQLAIVDLATANGQLDSGRIKVLGVMDKTRSALAKELPTLNEAGLPGFESSGWFALLAPAGTPAPIVSRLNAEVTDILKSAEVQKKFAAIGLEALTSTPEELALKMESETARWARVIRESGATVD